MKRPKPTKQMVLDVSGGNSALIESMHHGLVETPLHEFYPYLDFDEVVAFAASSWKSRDKNLNDFKRKIWSASIYDIFNEVYQIGFPWLNKYKSESTSKTIETHRKLNPFGGVGLMERLSESKQHAKNELRSKLMEDTSEYVFECQYRGRKAARGGDNYKLEIMRFQNVYPKRGRIVPAFASEIARILKKYPQEYSPGSFNKFDF